MSQVSENYRYILERIEQACFVAGRDPKDILFLGVTKTIDCEKISEALNCGIKAIGENRVQEFLEK